MAGEPSKTDRFTQIQEIIFGEQTKAWEERFAALEKRLAAFENQTDQRMGKAAEDHQESDLKTNRDITELGERMTRDENQTAQKFEALKNEFEKALAKLDADKMDKSALGDFLIRWGKEVKTL